MGEERKQKLSWVAEVLYTGEDERRERAAGWGQLVQGRTGGVLDV